MLVGKEGDFRKKSPETSEILSLFVNELEASVEGIRGTQDDLSPVGQC